MPNRCCKTITAGAVAIIPAVRWAGISQIRGRPIEARVPSDPLVASLDALQSELDEGPCITALREHHTVHIDDMSQHTQWPRSAQAALKLGVRCSLSFQLFVQKDNFGALNLYGGEAGVFDDDSFLYGEILAQRAPPAIPWPVPKQPNRCTARSPAVTSPNKTKGIIMERFQVAGSGLRTVDPAVPRIEHQTVGRRRARHRNTTQTRLTTRPHEHPTPDMRATEQVTAPTLARGNRQTESRPNALHRCTARSMPISGTST